MDRKGGEDMTIETKYNIGDEVWTRFANEAILCTIDDVRIIEDDGFLKVVYSVSDLNERMFGSRFINELFPTKEELLKSL